jgi:DNA-binding protein YbaB
VTRLSDITVAAEADGVEVRVNVEGRLVGLTIEPRALSAGATALAESIHRLVQEASAEALDRGVEALAPHVGAELAEELRSLVLSPPPAAESERDFSTVETWAVPR